MEAITPPMPAPTIPTLSSRLAILPSGRSVEDVEVGLRFRYPRADFNRKTPAVQKLEQEVKTKEA